MKSLDELLREREDYDFEAKAAQGRDGRGEVPRSVWESYSAMANTEGGTILLGAKEEDTGNLSLLGIKNVARVRKTLWDSLNNREIVSINLLREQDVVEIGQEGVQLLCVQVPRATRTQRPVYVGANPLTGTFRRNYEGDYKCNEETVRRMMAEAVEEIRDARVLQGFNLSDLDAESLAAYRNVLKSTNSQHPFLAFDDVEFLRHLGGWATDRPTGATGLTLAGLLMFGRMHAILDAVPNYVVDYQEWPHSPSEQRWIDRVTTDGTWSGNLFDFYRRVYRKLIADLKVPFRLQDGSKRIDEDHVHEALREALVNTLIHADFTDPSSILIIKRHDFFRFRNPGGLRLPVETILRGGESDCRNRRLQKMFQLIGAAEQAGSGFPKILRAWREQHWRYPLLDEKFQPEQAILYLPTTSLLPPAAVEELDRRFGTSFRELREIERLALVTALVEGKVTNRRLREVTDTHASDLTAIFKSLVHGGFLVPDGIGRGTSYRPSDQGEQEAASSDISDSFDSQQLGPSLPDLSVRSPDLGPSLPDLNARSTDLGPSLPDLAIETEEYQRLLAIAAPIRASRKSPAEQISNTILQLCQGSYLSLRTLAALLGRKPGTLQESYINPMIKSKQLEYRFPDRINHPEQGYRTVRTEHPVDGEAE